ncbi:HprK-related kinase A [Rheinheimera texasensis]|uniref:HprK-related kinase A n=1 Tax=Rheinheimera texasensis TaxID=306205 RepID=UPI000568B184|nr:HprK-related kinase A [Rheinheimera texasensis]
MTRPFALELAPFKFLINTSSSHLYHQLSDLYPSEILIAEELNSIYDFKVSYKSRFWQPGGSMAFQLGHQHFRYADPSQAVPMFEWGLNWCVATYQSRFLCIHAAVLEKNGVAVILPAPPGSGKSTLCAMMMLQGWRLLSDEHCMVDPVSGNIVPCVRPLSLKNNSLAVISRLFPDVKLFQKTEKTHKGTMAYLQPTATSWQKREVTARPRLVIFPKFNAAAQDLSGYALTQSQLFMQLAVNSFNYSVMGQTGFDALCRLSSSVEGYCFEYNDGQLAINEIEALLNEE